MELQTWVKHKGVEICIREGRDLYGEDALQLALVHLDWVCNTELRNIRFLMDITGSLVDREVLRLYKETARNHKDKFYKIAVVSAEGLLQYFCMVVIKFSGINAHFFDSQQEAMDWLAK